MYIYITILLRKIEEKNREWEPMLHDIGLICLFHRTIDHRGFDISSVYEIILKTPVPPGQERLSDKAGHPEIPLGILHREQGAGHISSVQRIDRVPEVPVSVSIHNGFSVADECYGDLGMRKRDPRHQVIDIGAFRHGGFQKFQTGRRIIENVPAYDGCSVRCTDLGAFLLFSPVDHIFDPCQRHRCLCDHLGLGDCGDRGKRLSAESQGTHTHQFLGTLQFGCCMAEKCSPYLIG